ncbi:oxidoreductase [Bacillus sp. V3-13]|uniref:FAD-dependent oxidoreductase n=1 Tax=Bacillus sp. V3-13 TaxID=2053728 RepID=UPI000C770DF5|nr:FAD-binding protein [Bacillus sp. V3-13]PLR76762.1 oxidoreductase [Bacillus sp. V3-13]
MEKTTKIIKGMEVPVYSVNTLVIGSGAAALNCAVHLHEFGVQDIAIVTERLGGGASNNSGSDKQTYYKMSISGKEADSPYELAKTLFDGGAMHGDIALVEATLSLQEFYHLVQLGVPFPHDKYGTFIGYKTDHDPKQRATSAGPRTSNQMFECLARDVTGKDIPVLDRHEVIALLTKTDGEQKKAIGAIAIDKNKMDSDHLGLVVLNCKNIVLGIGGPGGMYQSSVYPEGQIGSIGIALTAGAIANNLTESQFGLSSIKVRWNVSGTYQQVIPKYISTDQDGNDPQEFLNEYFDSMGKLATCIFLKGYQWPFDARKLTNFGSSIIDILVYNERVVKGRRVFMDFRSNPEGDDRIGAFTFNDLEPEASEYLERSGALFGTPIERLEKMNKLAIEFYQSRGIDLYKEPLEIAVCSQHNNGGLKGNIWWESNVQHLFPVGEVNGTHGIYRPGGSSLNSGQVGGYRAAQFIAANYNSSPQQIDQFVEEAGEQINELFTSYQNISKRVNPNSTYGEEIRAEIQTNMTLSGSHIRELNTVSQALEKAEALYQQYDENLEIRSREEVLGSIQNKMLLVTQIAYLSSIKKYLEEGGGSRGSYIVLDPEGEQIHPKLDENWKIKNENSFLRDKIIETSFTSSEHFESRLVHVRPIPEDDEWFENVWNQYLQGEIVRGETSGK